MGKPVCYKIRLRYANVLLGILLLSYSPRAIATDADLNPVHFDERLRGIPFGRDFQAFVKYAAKSTQGLYHQRIESTPERNERDKLRVESGERVQQIRDSRIVFAGQETGYNVSVIGGDFAHHSGESMAVAKHLRVQDFFFFQNDNLWKVVVSDPNIREFAEFLVKLTSLYGPPKDIDYRAPTEGRAPYRAVWANPTFIFEVEQRPDFGTVTLRWSVRSVLDSIQTSRGNNKPPATASDNSLDPDILDIMKD
jgi:hypothetical protein